MKALENALTQLNKTYGKGSVMKFSDKVADTNLQVISTGCLDLDMALGVGGLPVSYTHLSWLRFSTAIRTPSPMRRPTTCSP